MCIVDIHSSVFKFWHSNVILFGQIVNFGSEGNTVLYNIWTNMNKVYMSPVTISEIETSDHNMVLLKPSGHLPYGNGSGMRTTIWAMGDNDNALFYRALSAVSWEPLFRLETCQEQYAYYQTMIYCLMEICFPYKIVTRHSWVGDGFRRLAHKRQRANISGNYAREKIIIIIIIIRQPFCPVVGQGLSMPSPNYPVLCCPLPYHVAPVFVQIVSPPLGWSPLSSFRAIWSPSGGTRGPSVVFEAVDMPFHFSHSVDYIYDFVLSLTQMLVLLSLYVMLSILLSILVCAAASLFCACLVSVHVSAPYVTAGSTHELYTCLYRQMARLLLNISGVSVCRPACHDSSVYLFVLVLFLEAVVLSQVYVALDILYQHIVHVHRGVVYNHHLCRCDVHLNTHSPTFIG